MLCCRSEERRKRPRLLSFPASRSPAMSFLTRSPARLAYIVSLAVSARASKSLPSSCARGASAASPRAAPSTLSLSWATSRASTARKRLVRTSSSLPYTFATSALQRRSASVPRASSEAPSASLQTPPSQQATASMMSWWAPPEDELVGVAARVLAAAVEGVIHDAARRGTLDSPVLRAELTALVSRYLR